jgi:hypothetical protein
LAYNEANVGFKGDAAMSLFDTLKEAFRQNPPELEKPHFYKASSEARNQLEFLREFWWTVSDDDRPQLERDIVMLLESIEGERCIEAELNSSDLPIVVLHDLHFVHDGVSTRIDYLVITAKFVLVIESKNLIGHLEVTREGEFIRSFEYEGQCSRDAIRSPFDLNREHLDVIRRQRAASKGNDVMKVAFERSFAQNYLSVVVVANPGTSLDLKAADMDIKRQIIRSSQLAGYIKGLLEDMKREPMPEKLMYELAYYFMKQHRPTEA